ncbi:MAG TPA: CopG family transcriptional regulator [Candidatus Merdivicinus faecavium]|nr:CopG family transcriptional regulator [Candidatus Merdivicinus faecavium]
MDELKITKKTEPVMFTIRVDKSIVDFYDHLARETNRSRNELIALALEFAMDKIRVEDLSPDQKNRN